MTMSRQPDRKYSPRVRAFFFALAALPLLGVAGPVAAQPGAYELVVEPEAPRAQQAISATVAVPVCRALTEVSHVEGAIEIGVRSALCFPRPGFRAMSVSLGKLPQGSYRLRVVDAEDPARPELVPERTLTVAPPVPGDFADEFEPLLDYSGWWMSADSERGEGWLVEHKVPDGMILSWVTYDADGQPTWLVMQATERSYRALIGPVYRSERQGDTVVRTLIGEGRFEGTAANTATFVLTLEDSVEDPVSTSLRRLAF